MEVHGHRLWKGQVLRLPSPRKPAMPLLPEPPVSEAGPATHWLCDPEVSPSPQSLSFLTFPNSGSHTARNAEG